MAPHLPSSGRTDRARRPSHDFWTPVAGDTPTVSSTYTDVSLQAAILKELEHGPAFKAEIHRRLKVNEERIGRQLRALRERRIVTLDKRKRWLLATAVASRAEKSAPKQEMVAREKLPRPVADRYKDLLR